jgi:ADP-ribosylglycohydrolase
MEINSFLLNKIWGAWTGKVVGGTYGSPVEGKKKDYIQNLSPSLNGWNSLHRRKINDDEQFELVVLLALEALSEEAFKDGYFSNSLLNPKYLGAYWMEFLTPKYIFTAEKAAYESAKLGIPWDKTGDEIFVNSKGNRTYRNEFFDWIGAQMKGEIFGMLLPAFGWNKENLTLQNDVTILKPCLDLSWQDALMAHRGVAVVGELFVSALVSVGITHDPFTYKEHVFYPKNSVEGKQGEENISIIGICSEKIKRDIIRIKHVLLNYANLAKEDVEKYFRFIDPVIKIHNEDPHPARWESAFRECVELWNNHEKDLMKKARIRLGHNKEWFNRRTEAIKVEPRVHTLLNNSAIVIGLIYGDGDFFQTIRIATECGEDTDYNAGNVGSILGSYLGQSLIPFYFKRMIHGEIQPAIKNWSDFSIENLSMRTFKQTKRFLKLNDSYTKPSNK